MNKPIKKHEPQLKIKRATFTAVVMSVGAVVIYFLAQILAVLVVSIIGFASGMTADRIETWFATTTGQFMTYLLVAVVGLWLIKKLISRLGIGRRSLGLVRPKLIDPLLALAGYGWYLPALYASSSIISMILPSVDFGQRQQLGFDTSTSGVELLMIGVALVLVPAVYEEILCRGLLFTGLRKRFSLWPAAVITSVLFAVAHLQWSSAAPLLWAAAFDTFLLSMILVYMREKTGSLWPGIGLHAIKNGVAFMLLFVFKIG